MEKALRLFNKFKIASVLFMFGIVLAGCSMNAATPITADSPGLFNHYLVYPFSWLLLKTASLFGDNYGFAIICVTIFIRILLLPLMIKQTKNMKAMQQIQPRLNELKEKYNGKDEETKKKLQEEMMKLFQSEGVNPISSGCLPIFIQMPILLAFYYAIMRTEAIAEHSFLWFDLGLPDPFYILPVLAAVTTFIQMKVSAKHSTANAQLAILNNVMPIMILFFALNFPSALSLYWVVGGCFGIAQAYYLNGEKIEPTQETAKS